MSAAAGSPAFGTVTLGEARDSALVALRAAGVDSPALDADLLVAAAGGVDRAVLLAHPERALAAQAIRPLREWVRRRAVGREPLAYVLGRQRFRSLDLGIDRRALVPRPETEGLVELAAAELPLGARVADVGTGSGAVALALKQERPDLDVVGTDTSAAALALAGENARTLGLAVGLVCGDLVDPVEGSLHAVVSNPPYVADGEAAGLAPEVLRHEPREALFAGADGLAVIRRLVAAVARREVAWLALEVGIGQASEAQALLARAGYRGVRSVPDLAGIPRIVAGARR